MPSTATERSVIRQLQIVFSLSTLLLLVSLIASFYSIRKLIQNSELVNHTNQVLLEAENIISSMKDAETGQRGYLVTLDPTFLQPYNGSRPRVQNSYDRLRMLTSDNQIQQNKLTRIKELYEAKFTQMQRVIDLSRRTASFSRDTVSRHREMVKGKMVMDDLRQVINLLKTDENNLLQTRLRQQQFLHYLHAYPAGDCSAYLHADHSFHVWANQKRPR